MNLSSYSKEELKDVLRILKDYRSVSMQIGKRAILSDQKQKEEKIFIIEHTEKIDKNALETFFNSACEKFFPEAPKNTFRKFMLNNKLVGGIRIFYGDDMVDLSFQDFVRTIV